MPKPLFTLVPNRWYAMQFVGDGFYPEGPHGCSPIYVQKVTPLKTGKDRLRMVFHHENYPAGVQNKDYEIRVLAREPEFLFAKQIGGSPGRHLLVSELTWAWMERFFGLRPKADGDDVQEHRNWA